MLKKGKVWLTLNEAMLQDGKDVSEYEQYCEDFGFQSCYDEDNFKRLLSELGEDIIRNASLYAENEEMMI